MHSADIDHYLLNSFCSSHLHLIWGRITTSSFSKCWLCNTIATSQNYKCDLSCLSHDQTLCIWLLVNLCHSTPSPWVKQLCFPRYYSHRHLWRGSIIVSSSSFTAILMPAFSSYWLCFWWIVGIVLLWWFPPIDSTCKVYGWVNRDIVNIPQKLPDEHFNEASYLQLVPKY